MFVVWCEGCLDWVVVWFYCGWVYFWGCLCWVLLFGCDRIFFSGCGIGVVCLCSGLGELCVRGWLGG